jgi:hypothetical protein
MARQKKNEWVYLHDAYLRLCSKVVPAGEALANAITIGEVPLRGLPWGKTLRVPIRVQAVREPTGSDILENKLYLKPPSGVKVNMALVHEDFTFVMVEWSAVDKYVRDIEHEPPAAGGDATKPKMPANKRDRARQAISALWPNGVPISSVLPNGSLCKQVIEWLQQDCKRQNVPFLAMSDDTILRAADRL